MAFVAQKKTRYVVGNVNLLRTYLEAHKFIIGKKKWLRYLTLFSFEW